MSKLKTDGTVVSRKTGLRMAKNPQRSLSWVHDRSLGAWGGYECRQADYVLESNGPNRGWTLYDSHTWDTLCTGTKTVCQQAAAKLHEQHLTSVLLSTERVEEPTEPRALDSSVKRFWLKNSYGWVFLYQIQDSLVTIHRSYRGSPVQAFTLPLPAGRLHYRSSLDQGFTSFEGNL